MFDVDLGSLALADDLEVGQFGIDDPGDYQDQTAPPPPREGNYLLRVTDFGVAKDFDTKQPVLQDDKWPVFEVRAIEILEPTEVARVVRLNQRLKTKPFPREGAGGTKQASEFSDFLRSFDVNVRYRGLIGEGDGDLPTGLQVLKDFMESGRTTRGRGMWKAYDKTWADQAIDAAGGRDNLTKEQLGKIIAQASVKGMKKFPKSSKGSYIPEWRGPSGEIVRAKFVIARWYPSSENVKIGLA